MSARLAALLCVFTLPPLQEAPHIDASGDWDIILVTTPHTGQEALALTKSDLVIQLYENGKPALITARGHTCRAKALILRVDENRAMFLGEEGRRNVQLATKQMLSGKTAVLSYWPSPCQEPRALEIALDGFAESLRTANQLSDAEVQNLEGQVIAEREAAEKAEAETRLKENPTAELLLAARGGNIVRVIASLDLGADVNARSDSNGYTPLIWAASRGHTETARLVLEAGAEVDARSTDGQTALMRAADYGWVEVVKLLLEAGADANAQSNNGITALKFATIKGYAEIIDLLKNAGASQEP